MKTKVLLASLLLGGLSMLNAQEIWSENFDAGDPAGWTFIDADQDGFNWASVQVTSSGAPVGTPLLRSASWNPTAGPLSPNNWAITPAIDLTSVTGSVTLQWEVVAHDADYDEENYTVYVSTDASIDSFMASTTTFNEVTEGVNVLTPRSLDLSSYAGQTIYIAFRHHDVTDIFTVAIDNVAVVAGTVSVENHLAGVFSIYPNPVKDVLNISNAIQAEISKVTIVDINGRIVKQTSVSNLQSAQINTTDLTAGVYFVTISSDQGELTKKIVKQ